MFLQVFVFIVLIFQANTWSGNFESSSAWIVSTCRRNCSTWDTYQCTSLNTEYRCKAGWTHNGDTNCTIPICYPCCKEGTCIKPNICECPSTSTGQFCQTAYTCQHAKQLPELQRRSRNSKVYGNDPPVNDQLLSADWYMVTDSRGQYRMPDWNFIPPLDGCGTNNPIYIKDTHPVVVSETSVNVAACVRTFSNDCYIEIPIAIRNCSGELQYYLPFTGQYQAYCFDPPEIQEIHDITAAPENFDPGNVSVLSNLAWTIRFDYYIPALYFECSFLQTAGLFYTVTWYVEAEVKFIKGPFGATDALKLTAEELNGKGFRFGILLRCGVQASVDTTGSLTRSTFSGEFFAGIKILNPNIVLNSSVQSVAVEFRSTVPIGCIHPVNKASCGERRLYVHIKNPNYCTDMKFQRCNAGIELLAQNDALTSGDIYTISVTSNFKFLEPTHFELHLQTGANPWVETFFVNQSLQAISVIVDESGWTPKHCSSHVDPHMKTFDNAYYENQESGDFVLYRNTKYGIEVQERTKPCNNDRASCTCQVAVRAGADVFVINRCPGTTWFNEYLACNDGGILDSVKINERNYKIYTPIGMVVEITTGNYDGSFMNVDIYSSPKDLHNVEGLCGYYDGNSINDFKMPDGSPATYGNTDNMFSRSWMVTKERGVLTGYDLNHLENWASINSLLCVCKESDEFVGGGPPQETDEASCEKKDNTACAYNASITRKKCNKISNRRRRSLQHSFNRKDFLEIAYREVAKRSIDSDPLTEEEVRGNCSNMIRNAPSVIQFPERLMGENIDEVIEHCVFDVKAADGDLSVGEIHVRSLDNVVKQTFSYEPNFVAKHMDIIQSFLQETCPNNCSGRGICSKGGECICTSPYHGSECQLYEADPINVDSMEGNGVCDTALGDDCRCHWFYTKNLLENFSCKFRQFEVNHVNSKTYLNELVVPGDYDDLFSGQCCLPETRNKRSVKSTGLGYEWELAISNDGTHFGSGRTLYTIDRTCLDVVNSSRKERSLILKDGYCLINLYCVADTEKLTSDQCQACSVHVDQFGWTNICLMPDNPTFPVVGIAAGTAVGAIVGVCVVIWICWKLKNKKVLEGTEGMNDNSGTTVNFNSNIYLDACTVSPEHPYETIEQ